MLEKLTEWVRANIRQAIVKGVMEAVDDLIAEQEQEQEGNANSFYGDMERQELLKVAYGRGLIKSLNTRQSNERLIELLEGDDEDG